MFKVFCIYVLLAVLTLTLIVSVDILGGVSLHFSIHSFYNILSTTTWSVSLLMIFFLILPLIIRIFKNFRNSGKTR